MLNRKLLEILCRLEAQEIKRLRQFIHSPYHTYGLSNQEITKLFDYIMASNADENNPALDKKTTNDALFPDKPFQEKGKNPIDTLTSDLLRLTKKFLYFESMEQEHNTAIQELASARFYRRFGMEERFWQSVEGMRKQLNAHPHQDAIHFLDHFLVESEVMHFKSLYNSSQDDANLETASAYLDKYFAISKLDTSCAMLYQNQMAAFETGPTIHLFKKLLSMIREEHFTDTPTIAIYQLVEQLIQNPFDKDLLILFEAFLQMHEQLMGPVQRYDMHAYLRSFYTRKYIRTGQLEDLDYLFQLQTRHLNAGYMYADGKLTSAALRNITRIGLRLGKTLEVKKILDAHPPEKIGGTSYPTEFFSLNMAEYHFALQDMDKAQETLVYRNFEDVNFSLQADILLLKIYFETQNELLDSKVKALLQKVRRTKVSDERKERYFNFLKKVDKISKYAWDKKSSKRAQLAEEIRSTTEIIEREWLLKQLA